MKTKYKYLLILAIMITLPLTSCSKPEPPKTDEEIMEELGTDAEIIVPDEPIEELTPQDSESMEIEEGEEGSF